MADRTNNRKRRLTSRASQAAQLAPSLVDDAAPLRTPAPTEPPEKSDEHRDGAYWQDRPDENPEMPTICLFDVIFWLMEVEPSVIEEYETARAKVNGNRAFAIAFDKAEAVLTVAIKGRRLPLYGYAGESQLELTRLPWATTLNLKFDASGQPDWDRDENGPRFYGRGYYDWPKTTTEVRGWTGLCFEKADVLGSARRTGAPGRPSSMDLVETEFERRAAAKALAETISEESRILAQWLRDKHPGERPTTPKTIKNKLAGKFRNAKGARN